MDYSQLSDKEINDLIISALIESGYFTADRQEVSDREYVNGEWCFGKGTYTSLRSNDGPSFVAHGNGRLLDYCNNAADAWPIIQENRISIMFDGTNPEYEGEYHEWCDAISSCQKYGIQHQSNPLRAAMVVFLMMRDSDANP
jgi:hypothetical protein